MPRNPTDCSKYIMYKLCCLDPNITDEYVGSTTNFKNRKTKHKSNCNNPNSKEYKLKVYEFIRENGGFENWNMIQIEEYPCNSKREAEAREEVLRKELKTTLNTRRPLRTEEEELEYRNKYYENNKDKILKQSKDYYVENIEKKKEYKKQYRGDNKEKIKEQQKEYYEKNKDIINAKKREYKEQNKDAINAKERERYRLKKTQEQSQ